MEISFGEMMDNDERTEIVDGYTYRYSAAWIKELETEHHWRHYWHQQKLMEGLVRPGDRVLEIGVGSGFTANYLRSRGVSVTTLDIDERKKPDIVANIVQYDFAESYDHILAFEVFEHIPFEQVRSILTKLHRSAGKFLFLSVPRNERRWLRLEIWLPFKIHKVLEVATRKRRITEPHHYWEVDDGKISMKSFREMLAEKGWEVRRREKFWSLIYLALEKIER